MNKMSVKDLKDLHGKKVLVRCDFNVPMKDGVITDENRIQGALPTIKYLLDNGAKVTLCSHMGKPHSIFSSEVKLNKKDQKKVDAGETTKEAIVEKAKKDEPKKLTLRVPYNRMIAYRLLYIKLSKYLLTKRKPFIFPLRKNKSTFS